MLGLRIIPTTNNEAFLVEHVGRENLEVIQDLYLDLGLNDDEMRQIADDEMDLANRKTPWHLARPMTGAEHHVWAVMQTVYRKAEGIAETLVESGVPERAIHVRLPCAPSTKILDRKWVSLDEYKQLIPIQRNRPFGHNGQVVYSNEGAFLYEKVANSWPGP